MVNKGTLLEKGEFTGFVRSPGRIEKVMKSVASCCVMLALLIGCGEPNLNDPKVREKVITEAIDADNLQTRRTPSGEELRYAPNQERPYAGWVKTGRELYSFQNGRPNGIYISWFRNNQNYQKGIFRNGKKNGLWTEWYENGQKHTEGPYKNGNRDGNWVFWYENGQKRSERTYAHGSRNGLSIERYPDGTEEAKGNYKAGGTDGTWTFWYANGQERSKGTYKDEIKDGLWTEWHQNGQKHSEGTYKEGVKNGLWTTWDIHGTEKPKENYTNGIPMVLIPAGEFQMGSEDKPKSLIVRIDNPEFGDDRGVMIMNQMVVWIDEIFNEIINAPEESRNMLIIKPGLKVLDKQIVEVIDTAKEAGIEKISIAYYGEQPKHTVYVDAFYMDVHEVTNAQYKKFIDANPQWQKDRFHNNNYLRLWNGNNYPQGQGNHPVVYVSWYAAMAYATWANKRLPTEAEWECAARGGLVGKAYPHGDTITQRDANYGKNIGDTTYVGRYPANDYGLHDITGNVSEWCLDEYDQNFHSSSPHNGIDRNPLSGANSIQSTLDNYSNITDYRVVRGGDWKSNYGRLRVTFRDKAHPRSTYNHIGFRCVRTVAP